MHTKLIRFHSGSKKGIVRSGNKLSTWIRNGVQKIGRRRDIQVGDLAAMYEEPHSRSHIKTLLPITGIEIL